MSEPDFSILIVAANRCVADRLGAAVATVGGETMRPSFGFVIRAREESEAMEAELRERFGDDAVGRLRELLTDFVERHRGAEELAANRARATERA